MKIYQLLHITLLFLGSMSLTNGQQTKEKHMRCIYVVQQFKPKGNSSPIRQNHFYRVYQNTTETTFYQLSDEFEYCLNFTFGLFMNAVLSTVIILLLMNSTKKGRRFLP